MSTQSSKKKRIGSRRRVTNQNKTSEDDNFLVKDGTTIAEHSIAALNTEAENAITNPDNLLSQTYEPPELIGNRRKLGSSRRHKGEKHVKATESHHKPEEEVEQKTKGSKSPETHHVLGAREPWKQEELSEASEHEMSGAYGSLLSVSGEELLSLLSVREMESDDRENSEVLRQDGNFQSSDLMCESNAELVALQVSAMPERSTDESSHTEKNGIKFYTRETFLLPHQEPSTKEEQSSIFSLSEVSQHSDNVVSEVTEEKQTQQFKTEDSSDSLRDDSQAWEIISGNLVDQVGVSSMHQSEFIVKPTADSDGSFKPEGFISHEKQDEQYKKANFNTSDSNIENHHVYNISNLQTSDADTANPKLGQVDEMGDGVDNKQTFPQKPEITFAHDDLSESSVQMQPGIKTSFDSKPHDSYATKDERDTGVNPFENRRKLGSSCRSKATQQAKDSDAESNKKTISEIVENMMDDEFIIEMVSSQTETAEQQNLMEGTLEEKVEIEELGSQVKDTLQLLSFADESTPEDQSKTECDMEEATLASPTGESFSTEEQRELHTLPDVERAHQLQEAENMVHVLEPVQMQDMLEVIPSTESVVHDATEYSEIVHVNQINQEARDTCCQSDLKTDDSAPNSNPDNILGEHPTKDNMEACNNRIKDYNKKAQISDREGGDTALGQSEGKAEGDVKILSEPLGHLEKEDVLIEVEESNSQTLQSELHVPVNTQPLETEDSLNPLAGEFDPKPAKEDVKETEENKPPETPIISSTEEAAVIDKLGGAAFEEVNTFDSSHTVEMNDEVTFEADASTPVNISEISHFKIIQNLTVKSSMEIRDNRLSNLCMASNKESKGTGETTELLKSDVNFKDNYLVSESHLKSEDIDSFVMLEATTESNTPKKLTDFDINGEHFEFSLPKEELHTDEALNETLSFTEVTGALHSNDALAENRVQGEEVEQTQIQEIYISPEGVADDAIGSFAIISENPTDQIRDSNKPELIEQSIHFATMQEYPNPNDNVLDNQVREGVLSVAEEPDTAVLFDSKPQDVSESNKEQTHTGFNDIKNRRKLASSRRHKDRQQVKDSVPESNSVHKVNKEMDTPQTERKRKEELCQGREFGETLDGLESNDPQKDNLQGNLHSDEALSKVQNQDVMPEQMQDMPELDSYSKYVTYDAAAYSVKNSGELIAEGEDSDIKQSESTLKSSIDSLSTKMGLHPHDVQEEHPTEDVNTEDLDQINEYLHVYDSKKAQQINNTDTASSQHEGFQEKEGVFVGVKEGHSSSQTLQSHHAPDPQDQKTNDDENKDLAAESFRGHKEEDFQEEKGNELYTTKMSLKEENAMQEKLMDTIFGVTATNNTAWTEDNDSQGEDNSCESTLVEELTVLCSNSTLEQQQHEELFNIVMAEEKLRSMVSGNENTEREMEKHLFRLDGKLYDDDMVSESALTEQLSLGTNQPGKNAENESSVEQVACSSSQGELSINEDEKEHRNSQVRTVCHLENTTNEIHEKPRQMQEVHEGIHSVAVKESEPSAHTLDFQPQLIETSGNQLGNRRKLGLSRRSKRRQHAKDAVTEASAESKEELVEKKSSDEALQMKTQDMLLVMEKEAEEHTDGHLKPPMELGNDKENLGTTLSHNLMDSSAIEKKAISPSPGQGDLVKPYQDIMEEEQEPGNLSTHMGQNTVRCDTIQPTLWEDDSDMQNTPCHDDIVHAISFSSVPLEQEGDCCDQKKEALSCDKDKEISVPQTNDAVRSVEHVTVDDSFTEEDTPINALVSGKDEVEEKCKDPMKKYHKDQGSMASQEIKPSELFSTTHDKADLLASVDTGLAVDFRTEPSVDVGEQSEISTIVSAVDSQDETQGLTVLDESGNLQEKFKQRKRKFGSNRHILRIAAGEEALKNKDETKERESHIAAKVKQSEKIEIESSVSKNQHKTNKNESIPDFGQKLQINKSDLQRTESNMMPNKNTLLLSNDEEYENTGESSVSFDETTQGSQNDERSESANTIQNQASKPAEEQVVADMKTLKSVVGGAEEKENKAEVSTQESCTKNEDDQDINLEMKNLGLILGSTSQKRKMGSTRKNLKPKTKEEDLPQSNEVRIEAIEVTTNVEDVSTDLLSGIKEEELQLHEDQEDSELKLQTTLLASSADPSSEGNSVSNNQLLETEHHLTPSYLPTTTQSTSTNHIVMSESTSAGRRRKMGSHRKSYGHKNNESQTAREVKIEDTENGDKSGSFTGQTEFKATEEESLDLRDISEVEKTNTASPDISTTDAREDAKLVSEKIPIQVTPAQHPNVKIQLDQERQETVSLAGTSIEAAGKSKSYNVVMVGDSSVGKTSFMKRAQSGKFSLDIPASIGIDSCLWTVVVDGKPVVLQLWDTAGQERFHSITRQVFHKAQAFLLMYDVTSSHSFSAVSYWASCIQDGAAEDVTVLLLGNKNDHAKHCVTTQEGRTLAKEHSFEFMECSAATGENVIESLETVARMLKQKVDTREEATVLFKEPQKKKSSGCC